MLLAACGEDTATSPSAGTGDARLQPFLDKRLRMTRYIVADSAGQVVQEVCGVRAEACRFDDVYIHSDGKFVIDECGCPPDDPRYEYSIWKPDPSESGMIVTSADGGSTYRMEIKGIADASLTLAIPFEDLSRGLSESMGTAVSAESGRKGAVLLTYAPNSPSDPSRGP